MSIAYQAIVLFVYVLPGIIFRKQLSLAGKFRQQRSLPDELAHSVIYAIALHGGMIGLCYLLPNCVPRVSLQAALMHAIGQFGPNGVRFDEAVKSVTDFLPWVIAYFVTVSLAAFLMGYACRYTFDNKKWRIVKWVAWIQDDEPFSHRFQEWQRFLDTESEGDKEVFRILTMIVELGKAPFLFIGKLEEVHFGVNGNPEAFVLSNASRRALIPGDRDPEEALNSERMHPIYGERLIVRAQDAKTINWAIRYLEATEEAAQEDGGESPDEIEIHELLD